MRYLPCQMIAAALLLFASLPAVADTEPMLERDKKIKAAQVVGALGPNLAGDSTNLYTGSTSFNITDVSLPGNNGLAVSVGRNYSVELKRNEASNATEAVPFLRAFGDWDLDIPYISGIYSNQLGWEIDSAVPNKRCSVLSQLKPGGGPAVGSPRNYPLTYPQWWPSEYWHGIDMNIPGAGKQPLLVATEAGVQRPTQGGPYHWTTKNDWWLSCLEGTANDAGGEAFVAISPSGDKYTFDHLTSRFVAKLQERICFYDGIFIPVPGSGGTHNECDYRRMTRKEYMMLATKVEDRFGNWVQYQYSNDAFARLLSITSSDGRTITLTYNAEGYVASVSNGTQTWTYEYVGQLGSGLKLSKVNLPDGTSWSHAMSFSVNTLMHECYETGEPEFCYAPLITSNTSSGTVTHPSGAVIEFNFNVHFKPSVNSNHGEGGSYPLGLVAKTISGPGTTTGTWRYSYSPERSEFMASCSSPAGCLKQVTIDATDPSGALTRSTFGLVPNLNQGMLLTEQTGSVVNGIPTFLTGSTVTYTSPAQSNGFVSLRGTNPLYQGEGLGDEAELFYSQHKIPVKQRQISQQGVLFTWRADSFDPVLGNPAQVTRFSSLGSTQTTVTNYAHNFSKWVLGQVGSVTCTSGPECTPAKVVSQTIFDAVTALPLQTYSFGLIKNTLTYNPDGTLLTIKDGRNYVTTISNAAGKGWYRGVPRLITFPDQTTTSATVNPDGTIAAVTDALASVTGYGYDSMGRMRSITYPAGDTTAWNGMTRNFGRVNVAEFGIPAGHWKQTVQTGTGLVSTFYDGQWRPVLTLTQDTAVAASKSYVVKRYDASGRESFSSYPVGTLSSVNDALTGISTTYDALGRPYQTRQHSEHGLLTTTMEYLDGFKTRVTNPRMFQTTTSYQVFDKPDTSRPVLIQAPAGVTTAITRDGFGKPHTVTRSGPAS